MLGERKIKRELFYKGSKLKIITKIKKKCKLLRE